MSHSPFYYLLQGENLSELEKFGKDKDPKHLAAVGRNLSLIAINAAARNDMAAAAAEREARIEKEERDSDRRKAQSVIDRAESEERYQEDVAKSMEHTRSRAGFVNPTSDEGVDSFLDSF